MNIYEFKHVYVYVYACCTKHMYAFLTYMHALNLWTCTHARACVRVRVNMYVCIYTCMLCYIPAWLYEYESVYAYMYRYVYAHHAYEYVFSLSSKWKPEGCRTIIPHTKIRIYGKHTRRMQRIVGTMIIVPTMLIPLHLPQVLIFSHASFLPMLLSYSLAFVRTRTRAFFLASTPPPLPRLSSPHPSLTSSCLRTHSLDAYAQKYLTNMYANIYVWLCERWCMCALACVCVCVCVHVNLYVMRVWGVHRELLADLCKHA